MRAADRRARDLSQETSGKRAGRRSACGASPLREICARENGLRFALRLADGYSPAFSWTNGTTGGAC